MKAWITMIVSILAIILLLYFGLNELIYSLMDNQFLDFKFTAVLFLILVFTWFMGLSGRKIIAFSAKEGVLSARNIRRVFLIAWFAGWIVVAVLFTSN